MRLGPGKHLKGRKLMNGLVKPEEFDYFHEACLLTSSFKRLLNIVFLIVDHHSRSCSL